MPRSRVDPNPDEICHGILAAGYPAYKDFIVEEARALARLGDVAEGEAGVLAALS